MKLDPKPIACHVLWHLEAQACTNQVAISATILDCSAWLAWTQVAFGVAVLEQLQQASAGARQPEGSSVLLPPQSSPEAGATYAGMSRTWKYPVHSLYWY
jgi:hypothetical protein